MVIILNDATSRCRSPSILVDTDRSLESRPNNGCTPRTMLHLSSGRGEPLEKMNIDCDAKDPVQNVDDVARVITPVIQDFMRENKKDLIRAGNFGPAERLYVQIAYPHFICMVPTVVTKVVKAVFDQLKTSE